MSKKLNESFEVLEELLRRTYDLISPMTHHDDLKELSPQIMDDQFKEKPECFVRMGTGPKHTLFPVCNRIGIKSPHMIQFSLKLAMKLNDVGDVDKKHLGAVITKLSSMMSKYSRPIPKPWRAAARKGISTRKFNDEMR